MSGFVVHGFLGTGKGKYVAGKMREALRAGLRVATNCDLFLDNMMPPESKQTAVRLPDKPTASDLMAAGKGYEGPIDNDRMGCMVLDELGSWMNARSFQDKERSGVLDWLIHSRKHRWHVYLVVQDVEMIDKQVRKGISEYLVRCINADRMKIPVIGAFLGKKHGKLPRMHIANMSMSAIPGIVIDREFYRGDDLHGAYDTDQIFRDWIRDPAAPGYKDEPYAGPFSYLSAWHHKGRFLEGLDVKRKVQLKPKLPLVLKLSQLTPDRAWHYARLLNLQGALNPSS